MLVSDLRSQRPLQRRLRDGPPVQGDTLHPDGHPLRRPGHRPRAALLPRLVLLLTTRGMSSIT